jgi:hypothetical protein
MAYTENKKLIGLDAKTTPIDADVLVVGDTVDSDRAKKTTWANIKATLKAYFDTLYPTTKATQAEVATGTDDDKYTTALAVQPYSNQSLYRQAIINGNFDVWQRGTSFTITDGLDVYTADRMRVVNLYSGNTFVASQLAVTDLPGSNFALQTSWNGNPTEQIRMEIYYTLENIDAKKYAGKVVTFSCKVKSKQGMTSLAIISEYNTTGAKITYTDSQILANSTNINTSTWTLVTQTFTVPSLADLTSTGTFGLRLVCGKTTGESTGDGIQITQIQLNAGSVALPFQPKSYAEELRDCQRYCVGITTVSVTEEIAQGMAASTTVSYPSITLPVTMRTLPTVTATAADWQLDDSINAPTDVNALVIDDLGFSNTRKVVLKASAASGLTANRPYYLVGDGNAGRVLIISAEL